MTLRVLALIVGHALARAAGVRIENDWDLDALWRRVRHAAATDLTVSARGTLQLLLNRRRIPRREQRDDRGDVRDEIGRARHSRAESQKRLKKYYFRRIFRSFAMCRFAAALPATMRAGLLARRVRRELELAARDARFRAFATPLRRRRFVDPVDLRAAPIAR